MNLLLVYSNTRTINILKKIINRMCAWMNIYYCTNYKQALQLLSTQPVDIIIFDPSISGVETGLKFVDRVYQIPSFNGYLIANTGHLDQSSIEQFHRHGIDKILPKPFNIDQIKQILAVTTI